MQACPSCGNSRENTGIYRCNRCGHIYCVIRWGGGCNKNNCCPKCGEKQAKKVGATRGG